MYSLSTPSATIWKLHVFTNFHVLDEDEDEDEEQDVFGLQCPDEEDEEEAEGEDEDDEESKGTLRNIVEAWNLERK